MPDDLFARLADVVPEALALPASERDAFLDRACTRSDGTPDPALRAEAAALIAASDAADASGALAAPPRTFSPTTDLPESIGPWRVTGLLGEGGMGVVYRAERMDGLFERTVALKRIRPELARTLAGRLDAERTALARLEHDGIARLYDGGVSDAGVPYLVMELADGAPITEHAEQSQLDVPSRVRLLIAVCEAVAYAHARLVVHRDLKPSNVFVTPDGRPKLLDFGIAKILGDGTGEALAETATRTHASMTPTYAAPEQLRHGDVTTVSDVYALGVMLYEVLAGQRPYSLAGASPAEAERIVCETVPPPPSTVAPADRAREIRGDLDTICLKALAKEPDQRYASAEALGVDLQRHLDGLPVLARRSTRRYRAGRFVRRHRVGVAASALVVVAIVVGAGVALWQARVARSEAAKATALNGFMLTMLSAANPDEDGRDVRVAELLDRAAASLDTAFAGHPDVRAAAGRSLGATYRELGLYPEADTLISHALALAEALYGPRHPDVSLLQADLGILRREQGRYPEADSLFSLALATDRSLFGPQSRRASLLWSELGVTRYDAGDLPAAAAAHREALSIDDAVLPADHPDLAEDIANLALTLADDGQSDAAAALLERAVAIQRRQRPVNGEHLGNALANLGSVRVDQGRAAEAAVLQREAVAQFRQALGDRHNYVGFGLNNLGSTLNSLGQYGESERALRESVSIYRATLGPRHPDLVYPLANLGRTLLATRQLADAEATLREAVSIARETQEPESLVLARCLAPLGQTLTRSGRASEAVPILREALAIRRAALPDGHSDRLIAASLLGDALWRSGATVKGDRFLRASASGLSRAAAAAPGNAALARQSAEAATRRAHAVSS